MHLLSCPVLFSLPGVCRVHGCPSSSLLSQHPSLFSHRRVRAGWVCRATVGILSQPAAERTQGRGFPARMRQIGSRTPPAN
ncbi:uncharacterized protein LY89DRAFT_70432 [Mollisia scopiformis]|uniref:Uncharacterized protein n=1 Tax=Mollisia scopiformis TaxID=149040 RepID=A0A194XA49_MOLSC|nr:uncharacterized protein LY89DRAFT_70432 [Mollisia scopiformis]KUJ17048.1 hypothetical protein LY89DRAFT_70432 [Mollisia scopiformis]